MCTITVALLMPTKQSFQFTQPLKETGWNSDKQSKMAWTRLKVHLQKTVCALYLNLCKASRRGEMCKNTAECLQKSSVRQKHKHEVITEQLSQVDFSSN